MCCFWHPSVSEVLEPPPHRKGLLQQAAAYFGNVCLFVCSLVCLFVCSFVGLFVCLFVCSFVCLFVCWSICSLVCLSLSVSDRLFVCLFVRLFVGRRVNPPKPGPKPGDPHEGSCGEEGGARGRRNPCKKGTLKGSKEN